MTASDSDILRHPIAGRRIANHPSVGRQPVIDVRKLVGIADDADSRTIERIAALPVSMQGYPKKIALQISFGEHEC
jgi:hypothetical protein